MFFAEFFLATAFVAVTSAFIVIVFAKIDTIKRLTSEISNLRNSLQEMDEQAKLIVRTDLQLNKTQEELDKKLTGLFALQKILRIISTSLEETQIFALIDPASLRELGFEHAVILLEDTSGHLRIPLHIGYSEEETEQLLINLTPHTQTLSHISDTGQTISSAHLNPQDALQQAAAHIFKTPSFIIAPIATKEGEKGVLFTGTNQPEASLSEGDEELITILAHQIGQAIENARLFEKTWLAQQSLEQKVTLRTTELKNAMAEMEKISRRKTDFISAVSHELRTPLTSIKGYASILLAGKLGDIPAEIKLRLEKINRHSDELTRMINDLLDIARIESGRVEMKKDRADLKTLVEQTFDLLGIQLKEHNLDFSYTIADDARFALCDALQIHRVFINLVGNALKFTPAGGKISIQTTHTDAFIKIDVTDTGYGIPPEAQQSIFEEFYRVDNEINQNVKGTGLGLSLVKRIIEAHGGTIRVKSKLHEGSTFSVTLPAAP